MEHPLTFSVIMLKPGMCIHLLLSLAQVLIDSPNIEEEEGCQYHQTVDFIFA